MKSSLFWILLICLIGSGCGKHSSSQPDFAREAIYGRWIIFEVGLLDAKTNTQMDMESSDPCNGESEWVLNKDDSYSLNAYHENKLGQCELTRSRVGDFSFNPLTKELVFTHEGYSDEKYSIYILNDNEMWINIGLIDTGDQDDRVYHIVKFRKNNFNE